MRHPYDASHIYDATGSAKARHYESLRAAEARHLADSFRHSDDGLITRSLSTRSAQVVKVYWWVPAGFAVLILLRSIIGG